MKNKKTFFIIYIILISIILISIITLSFLGNKKRIGYLSEFKINVDNTLEINGLNVNETKQLFTINNELDETSINNFIFTNTSITNYSYNFRIKYYSKVFRNSDIYGVYLNINKILENNNYIKKIEMGKNGSPFGNLVSDKIIDFENIDNIDYKLKVKHNFIWLSIVLLVILLVIYIIYININYIYNLFINIKILLMRYKKFNLIIYSIAIFTLIILMLLLSFLGGKKRIGYLSEFKINIDNTLEINGLNVNETKQLFTINNELDEISINNFIFTNTSITNYSYNFRIKYYSKVFRNSDIYGVYTDTNKIIQDNDFIKEIKFYYKGSPFGNLISDKIIDFEKIDNINYKLSLKYSIIMLFIFIYTIYTFFLYVRKILFENDKYKLLFYILTLIFSLSVIYVLQINILYKIDLLIFLSEFIFIYKYNKNIYKFINNIAIHNKIYLFVSFILLALILCLNIFINVSLIIKYIILFIYLNIFFIFFGILSINKFNLLVNFKNLFYISFFIFLFNINMSYNYLNSNNNLNKFAIFFIFSLVLSTFFFIFYLYSEHKKIKIEKIFLVSFIVIGLSYLILLPYLQTPDEGAHFIRANEIAHGYFVSEKNSDDSKYPLEFVHMISSYDELIRKIISYNIQEKNYTPSHISSASVYSFISYIPQSIGIFIGNLFNYNFLISVYLGRIFNFLFYTICLYMSIKYLPFKKISLYFISFLPMTLQEAISLAVDPVIISVSILILSICLNIRYREKEIMLKEIILLYILSIFIAGTKIVYLPLVFIILIIPFNKKLKIIIPAIVLAILINIIWLYISFKYLPSSNDNSKAQVLFVLNNLFEYFTIFISTILRYFSVYIELMIGKLLSWFSIEIPNFAYFYFLFLLIFFFIFDNDKKYKSINIDIHLKLIIFIIVSITIGLIFTALYVQWTAGTLGKIGSKEISGVQGRYFLPILFYIFTLFSNNIFKININSIKINIFISIVMINILVLNKIFNTFYI